MALFRRRRPLGVRILAWSAGVLASSAASYYVGRFIVANRRMRR